MMRMLVVCGRIRYTLHHLGESLRKKLKSGNMLKTSKDICGLKTTSNITRHLNVGLCHSTTL